MQHIADFFNWLFDFRTNELMPIMFIIGALALLVFLSTVAFLMSPFFGVGFILSILFGVPILVYLDQKNRKGK